MPPRKCLGCEFPWIPTAFSRCPPRAPTQTVLFPFFPGLSPSGSVCLFSCLPTEGGRSCLPPTLQWHYPVAIPVYPKDDILLSPSPTCSSPRRHASFPTSPCLLLTPRKTSFFPYVNPVCAKEEKTPFFL